MTSRLHRISKNGRVGFIDAKGSVCIPPELDEASAFSEGLAVAKRGAVWGYIDTDGTWAIEPRFEEARPFQGGAARVLVTIPGERGGPPVGSGWELIDARGKTIAHAPDVAIDGDVVNGLARVQLERGPTRRGYIRRDGTWAFGIDADACGDFHDDRAWFSRGGTWRGTSYLLNGRRTEGSTFVAGPYGFLDAGGAEVAPPSFQLAESFAEGVAVVRQGATWVERPYAYEVVGMHITESAIWTLSGGGHGFVARDGSLAIAPSFGHARRFSEGLAPVYVGGAWTDEPLARDGVTTVVHALRGGHYGFVDARGQLPIAPTWDDAHPLSNGLARVRTNDRWGYIDAAGAVRIAPRFVDASDFEGELARVTSGDDWGWVTRDGVWAWRSG
jgi:WG containing repeat